VARQFKIEIESGAELVKVPYIVESFPVSVEQQYVIVEL